MPVADQYFICWEIHQFRQISFCDISTQPNSVINSFTTLLYSVNKTHVNDIGKAGKTA